MTNPNPATFPGTDTDVLIVRKLGYTWEWRIGGLGDRIPRWVNPTTGDDAYPSHQWPQPEYSTNWNAAAELLIKARLTLIPTEKNGKWFCGKIVYNSAMYGLEDGSPSIDCYFEDGAAIADTGPLAVCKAFLALPDEVVNQ